MNNHLIKAMNFHAGASWYSDVGVGNYLLGVAQSISQHLHNNVLVNPPLGRQDIELLYSINKNPEIVYPLQHDKYLMAISVPGIFPLQAIYQIAHELCHIYIDPRLTGVFVEVICQKTALDVLEDIGPNFLSDQADFDGYIAKIRTEAEAQLAPEAIANTSILQMIQWAEKWQDIYSNRPYLNLIAFKLKALTDLKLGKYELIRHVINGVDPTPAAGSFCLTEIHHRTLFNVEAFIDSVVAESEDFAATISRIKASGND